MAVGNRECVDFIGVANDGQLTADMLVGKVPYRHPVPAASFDVNIGIAASPNC